MQANFSDQLRRAISHERLDAYRQRGTSNDDSELFAHYAWNMALSESLYTPLQCLEVCLRNGIHDAATAYFKTRKKLWTLPGLNMCVQENTGSVPSFPGSVPSFLLVSSGAFPHRPY